MEKLQNTLELNDRIITERLLFRTVCVCVRVCVRIRTQWECFRRRRQRRWRRRWRRWRLHIFTLIGGMCGGIRVPETICFWCESRIWRAVLRVCVCYVCTPHVFVCMCLCVCLCLFVRMRVPECLMAGTSVSSAVAAGCFAWMLSFWSFYVSYARNRSIRNGGQ